MIPATASPPAARAPLLEQLGHAVVTEIRVARLWLERHGEVGAAQWSAIDAALEALMLARWGWR